MLSSQERTGLNVQIWKSYVDEMDISVISPSGMRAGPIQEILGASAAVSGRDGTSSVLWGAKAIQRKTGDLHFFASGVILY